MQQTSNGARSARAFSLFRIQMLLLLAALMCSPFASAQTSTLCPTLSATVDYGGTVSINATTCHAGFGLGTVAQAPVHGTATVGPFGATQFINYSHNGATGTTDSFVVLDGEPPPNNRILVNITITPPTSAIVVTPASLPSMTAGTPFSQTLSSTGGVAPYTYSLSSGALPTGLTLTSAGVISGTPTQRGAYTFSVRSQDSVGDFVVKGYTGTVLNPTLTLSPPAATAVQNAPFSLGLAVNGGVAPHSFLHETVAGPLPPGISLSSSGVLSGTPTTVGTTNFQMRVTDSSTGPGSYFELENYTFNVVAPPVVTIAVTPASVSEDGGTNLTYTVTRTPSIAAATVVNLSAAGTATSGSDYTGAPATVTIPSGATSATFVIDPTVDGTVEADETVTFTVAPGTGYTVGSPSSATGTILNDDVPTMTITVSPANVAEDGAANLVYTVALSQAAFNPISVNFAITGTAINGTDYGTITSPLVIPTGATSGTITVNPTADTTIEANETVTLTLNAGTGYTVGVPNAATGTILNDDLPNLTINDVTANEGVAGVTNFTFTVSLSAPAGPGGVTFDIATANGSATAGVDYIAQSLTGQTIPAGSSTYTFTVLVNGDALNEPSETFFVNVTNAVNAVILDGQGVGTIVNDDPLPSLSINDVTVVEGNAGVVNANFTVTLSAPSGQTVSVNYATADGTATAPGDYTSLSGALIFSPGQTAQAISVFVNGEIVPEANETFFVNLSGATNATIADNQGVGTITNDDVPVTVSPATLPNAQIPNAYSQTITASGGTAPYTFAVTAGALPAGLSLSPGGVLSGTPTAGGSFNFTVSATDSSASPGPFTGTRAYTLVVQPPTPTLPPDTLPDGTLGQAYSGNVGPAANGTLPFSYAVTAGALPGGLTLNPASGAITGTPTALGTFNFSVTATDSSTGTGPYTVTQAYTVVIIDVPPVANPVSLTVPYNAPATNVPLNITGGAPVSVAVVTPPTNGTVVVAGVTITYQPNPGYAGPDSFTYTATNSGGTSAPATVTITVQNPVITITAGGSLSGTVGTAYSQTFTFNGGAQPWTGYLVTNLPAGLTITGTTANTVTISGTPTQAGSFNLTVSATDTSTGNGPFNFADVFTLNIAAPTLTLAPASTTFNPAYGAPFSQTFTAGGGIGPYTYTVTGTLPTGLTLSGGTVSGTPTVPGNYVVLITATDTGSTGTGAPFTVGQSYTFNVSAPTIVVSPATLPNPTAAVAYSQTITAAGGVAPYTFAVSAGSLPPGITLGSGGALAGTSNQVGSYSFTITATDTFGQTGSRAYTVTIAAPTLTMTPAPGTLNAPYATPFSQTFTAAGGSNSFSYALIGALPAGMSFSGNTISGTPTAPGSYPITVTATDTVLTGVGAPFSIAQNYTIDVPAPTIVVDPATIPNGTAGQVYPTTTFSVSGGVAPYQIQITSGLLPAGLSITGAGVISGLPSQVGSFPITVTGRDANGQTGTRSYTIVIAPPVLTLTPAAGTLVAPYGVAYSQTFVGGGNIAPMTYTVTGALPAGLTVFAGTISGTPTVPGSYPISVTATDNFITGPAAPYSITQNYTIDVPAPTIVVNPATLPNTTAGLGYSETLTASGGVSPYTFSVTAGSLPTGLTLGSGGAISGTTTASGTFNFTVTASDANGQTGARAYTVVVAVPTLTLTPATLPGGTAGTPYSQTLTIGGGIAPYTVTQTGALPTGLTFNAGTRTFSGTPTQSGSFNISVTVTDSTGGTAATITNNYTLVIATPTLTLTPATVPAGTAGVAYTQTFVASGGIAPYTYAVSAGALPAGLTLNATTGALSGTPTVAGTFTFSVRATDSTTGTAATVVNAYTLVLSAPTITVNPPVLPGAVFGIPYNHVINAVGGTAPYTFAVTAGALPAGVTLSAGGTLSGATTVTGTFSFTITATDGLGFTGSRAYTINVVQRPDPTQDAEVRGLLNAQVDSTRRFAEGQVNNFQQRMERLHDGGERGNGGFANNIGFSTRDRCVEQVGQIPGQPCQQQRQTLGEGEGGVGGGIGNTGGMGNSAAGRNDGGSNFGVWAAGNVRSGNHDGRGVGGGVDFETDGISAGIDYRFSPSFALGAGVGYGRDDNEIGNRGSRVKGDAYAFAVYGSYHPGDTFFLDGLIGYQRLDYELSRWVTSNGNTVRGQRDGDQWFASISAGADFERGAWHFTPYARIDAARATLDAYAETGDALYALSYGEMDVDTTTGSLGLRIDYSRKTGWGMFSPQLRLEYQHDFDADATAVIRYADNIGPFYRTDVLGFDRNRFVIGLGALFRTESDWSFRVEYRGLIDGDDRDNGLLFNVEKRY